MLETKEINSLEMICDMIMISKSVIILSSWVICGIIVISKSIMILPYTRDSLYRQSVQSVQVLVYCQKTKIFPIITKVFIHTI